MNLDYYSFYDVEKKLQKRRCLILLVKFSRYYEGCGFPEKAILKIIETEDYHYWQTECEISVKASSRHSCFIQIYHHFHDTNQKRFYFFMEYCELGSLWNYINHTRWNYFQMLFRMKEIAKAIKLLHEISVTHRDLKPDNIFVTKAGRIKIGDLGYAKEQVEDLSSTHLGTDYYKSPQNRDTSQQLDYFKEDIWNLGVTFYRISIENNERFENLARFDQKDIDLRINSINYPDFIKSIILKCLKIDPENRITSNEIYERLKNKIKELGLEMSSKEIDFQYKESCSELKSDENFSVQQKNGKCTNCFLSPAEIVDFRFSHEIDLYCLKMLTCNNLNKTRCIVCGDFQIKDLSNITNNLLILSLDHQECILPFSKLERRSHLHCFLRFDHHFQSKLYECSSEIQGTNKICCTLCDKNDVHSHCDAIKFFFQQYQEKFLIHSTRLSQVYLQHYKKINLPEQYIVKKVPLTERNLKSAHIHSFASFVSKNILKLYYWTVEEDFLYLYLEYARQKTLKSLINKKKIKNTNFTRDEIESISKDLSTALNCLHQNFVYLKNIKASNIFLTNENELKIGKFKESEIFQQENPQLRENDESRISELIFSLLNNLRL